MIICKNIADIFRALYFLLDHSLYFTRIGIIKSWAPKRLERLAWWSSFFWLLSSVFDVFCCIVVIKDFVEEMNILVRNCEYQKNFIETLEKKNSISKNGTISDEKIPKYYSEEA